MVGQAVGTLTIRYDGRATATFLVASDRLSSSPRLRQYLREALAAAGDQTRTQVRRALKEQMGVKSAAIVNSRTRSYITAEPAYVIEARGKGLPIIDFKGLRVKAGPHGGVSAAPWNVARQFKRSFANGGYRARLTSKRFPVRTLRGASPSKELVKDRSLATFESVAPPEVQAAVMRKLARLLP